jgi:hypothetical protein
VQPFLSVAVTSKVKGPVAVGVPDSVPLEERLSPVGCAPLVMAKVNGPTTPEAVIVWL